MGNQLGSSLATIYERHRTGFTLASIAVDAVLLWVAFWAAWLLRYRFDIGGQVLPWDLQPFSAFHGRAALFVGLALIVLVIRGVYRQLHWPSIIDETVMLVGSLTVAMGGVVLANYLSRFSPSRLVFIYAWFIAIVLLVLTRIVRRSVLHSLWRRSIGIERVLVIGSGEIGRRVCQAIMGSPNSRLRVAGFVSESGRREAFTVGTEDGIRFAPSLGLLGDLQGCSSEAVSITSFWLSLLKPMTRWSR